MEEVCDTYELKWSSAACRVCARAHSSPHPRTWILNFLRARSYSPLRVLNIDMPAGSGDPRGGVVKARRAYA